MTMMFCGKCGKKLDDNMVFCPDCGENIKKSASVEPIKLDTSLERQGKIIGNVLRIVVAIVVIVLIIIGVKKLFFRDTYEDLVKKYCNAIEEKNAEKIISLIPNECMEAAVQSGEDKEEIVRKLENHLNSMWINAKNKYGDELDFSYDIIKTKKCDEDRIKKLNMEFKDEYDIKGEISECYNLELKIELKGDKGSISKTPDINVIKIDENWYLDPGSI